MKIADWLMITAVFLGPIVAVRLTRFLDNKKEERERKLGIFKKLMATRAYTTSWDHVEALNRIDLEFNPKNKNERPVIDAWKAYLELLGDGAMPPEQWGVRRVDLLIELLHKMAAVLDYDFDKTHIKTSAYAPIAHGTVEEEQKELRAGVIALLKGNKPLPMFIVNWPENMEAPTEHHAHVLDTATPEGRVAP